MTSGQEWAQGQSGPPAHTTAHLGKVEATDSEELVGSPMDNDSQAAINALPAESALLIVQHGPNVGARFLLDSERTTVGRDTKADIFLDDVTVSRKHVEFIKDGENFVVRDVGSLNGTYVNRDRVDEGILNVGDEVQIGKYRLTFHPSPQRADAETDSEDPTAGDNHAGDNDADAGDSDS